MRFDVEWIYIEMLNITPSFRSNVKVHVFLFKELVLLYTSISVELNCDSHFKDCSFIYNQHPFFVWIKCSSESLNINIAFSVFDEHSILILINIERCLIYQMKLQQSCTILYIYLVLYLITLIFEKNISVYPDIIQKLLS